MYFWYEIERFYPYKGFLLEYFILLQDLPQILKKELYFFDLLCSCKGKITINGLKVKYVCCWSIHLDFYANSKKSAQNKPIDNTDPYFFSLL